MRTLGPTSLLTCIVDPVVAITVAVPSGSFARRGAPLFAARGAMDRPIVGKSAGLALPTVESVEALTGELADREARQAW